MKDEYALDKEIKKRWGTRGKHSVGHGDKAYSICKKEWRVRKWQIGVW